MITWRGAGCLSLLLPFLGFGVGFIIGDSMSTVTQGVLSGVGILLGSVIVLILGLIMNSPAKMMDQARQQGMSEQELAVLRQTLKTRHTLYSIPMQWPGLFGTIFGLVLIAVALWGD